MKIRDVYNAKAVALRHTEVASNKQEYLGRMLFPSIKKMGLDLKWIKTSTGLPVSLMPSAFDAKSTLRSREGISLTKTQMAFFRESMLVSEEDEQDILRVSEATDPYAQDVINHVYGDALKLTEGAKVVGERMIWQLLAPTNGIPKISIQANGVTYAYNYDPDGKFLANNYTAISGTTDKWSDSTNSDPLEDLRKAQESIEDATGEKPSIAVMSKKTMGYLVKNAKLRNAILAQNATANIFMTEQRVKDLLNNELGLQIIVYTKKFKDEDGVAHSFYPDDMVTLIPASGQLGNLYYGTTPEERTLLGDATADVAIVDTGVAVTITTTNDPVNTKTTVSQIVLPSFEGMDSVYVLKVA